jgi:hypothetical protein
MHTKIKIVDARMGKGKTSWAIQHMNKDVNNQYVYITPFLAEVKRIKDNCHERKFREPINFGNGKQDNLHELLAHNSNIVSTHALFRTSTDVTRELIACGDYVLILDEVMDVVEQIKLKKDDIPSMIELELITLEEDGTVIWNPEKLDYDGKYNDIKLMSLNKTLMIINNTMLMWNFPIEAFLSFKEVYIMTYMFNAQVQRYYYDMFELNYSYSTVINKDDKYQLVDISNPQELRDYDDVAQLKPLISIVKSDKLNGVGNNKYALSSTWFGKKDNEIFLKILQNNVYNYFRNVASAKAKDLLWTTFKSAKSELKGNGYSRGFIACNLRATNEYGDRHYLAYCVNIFLNPILSSFFINKGVSIDEDGYALSEMLQWIWRSAIRNGEKIEIYIPSSRMRGLLQEYLGIEVE